MENNLPPVTRFLVDIAEDPNLMTLFEENPHKVLEDAGIPEGKWDDIMSADLERVQALVASEGGFRVVIIVVVVKSKLT